MTHTPFKAVILAAGLGTRMKSALPKVMHPVLGRPMLSYPIDIALAAGAVEVAVVVGHGRERVEAWLGRRYSGEVTTHVQHEMNGTADAVKAAWGAFSEFDGAVMILSGDVPNLPPEVVTELVGVHDEHRATMSLLTAHDPTPNAYGRIVRDSNGRPVRIVEFKDATTSERAITEVNIGTYLVEAGFLRDGLSRLNTDNAAGEFYLTDLVGLAYEAGRPAQAVVGGDIEALHGVNDRAQLAAAQEYARRRRNVAIMRSGVTMIDPSTVTVDADVVVGSDVTIEPGVVLLGETRVGAGATIEAFCRIENAEVHAGERVPALTSRRA